LLVRWRNESMSRVDSRAPVLSVDARLARLTAREREILALLAAAPQNREIARQLEISPRIVGVHKARIVEKLECHSLAALIRMNLPAG